MSDKWTLLNLVVALAMTVATGGCNQPAQQTASPNNPPDTPESAQPADNGTNEPAAGPETAGPTVDSETADPADDDADPSDGAATDDSSATDVELVGRGLTEDDPDDTSDPAPTEVAAANPAASEPGEITGDWPQWGGDSQRNNTPIGKGIPHQWKPGKFEGNPARWNPDTAENVKWVARLGSQSYGNATIAGGKIYVGTNNRAGWLERFPADVDLGCLIAFDIKDGKFLWQHSSKKLKTGRVHDWPLQGICCAPLIEGQRLWFVTSRGEVRCLDTEGFLDGENDGPYSEEDNENKDEADVIWVFNMMKELGVSQHNMCSCSVTAAGDILFVNTSNGVDESHILLPAPDAPSFIAMDKNTGKVLWTDSSPGINILHGQWSSPTYGVLSGVPQVLFAGGDGWLYSFAPAGSEDGKSKLLWKFDCNPKESKWELGGRGTRNNLIATPVIHDDLVYVAVGQDPEHAEGNGHLWCIDPTKRGDVSPTLAFKLDDTENPIPPRRLQSVDATKGEVARDNPNSAVVWHYDKYDQDGNGEIDWEEEMHRSCGTVAIKDGILYISDFSGLFHCLDAKTGKVHWTHDMLAAAWGSPLIVDGKVYIGDEDGDITIFKHAQEMQMLSVDEYGDPGPINMGNSVYSTPIVSNNVLYISNKTHLFAIEANGKAEVAEAGAATE